MPPTSAWRWSSSYRCGRRPRPSSWRSGWGTPGRSWTAKGIVDPDYCLYGDRHSPEPTPAFWRRVLPPRVTEIVIHRALPSDEIRHTTRHTSHPFTWEAPAADHRLFTGDAEIRALLEARGWTSSAIGHPDI